MNPEVKEKWLTALRSGDYAQGKGKLERVVDGQSKYCCLGVLCDLAVKAGITTRTDPITNGTLAHYGEMFDNFPPQVVVEWAGIGTSNPNVLIPEREGELSRATNLAELNDEKNYTFSQIADVIEAAL
jgi:hypothetical protein